MSAQENGVNLKNNESQTEPMTLAAVRAKLNGTKGKRFWRSLDELAGTEEFQNAVEQEFPAGLLLAVGELVDGALRGCRFVGDRRPTGAGGQQAQRQGDGPSLVRMCHGEGTSQGWWGRKRVGAKVL